ncbi:glycosyltransferase [Variovorax sp. M-6]|uniref:glycosyltransferase family protein n=1 Tax=Variovorax sp. M-6 TaxID=3233041 RepID=UPI003F9B3A0D
METTHSLPDASSPVAIAGYAVILTTADPVDRSRSAVFAEELAAAFGSLGFTTRTFEYKKDVRQVSAALADPDCKFFVCFNGFGSELLLTSATPGYLTPAFEHYGKPLLDLVDDCPIHEDMRHQIDSVGPIRKLMVTDYGYAYLARLAGMGSVRTVPGIAFPTSVRSEPKPLADRPIDILLPLADLRPEQMRGRHDGAHGYKSRVFREIFDSVADRASTDLDIDPWVQTLIALQETGIAADLKHPDLRFLLSSVVDHVAAQRQRMLLDATRHLPLTIVGDAKLQAEFAAGPNSRFIGSTSFADLLDTMAESKAVVCPIAHRTGGRERAMAAFSAGALVVASTDEVLEAEFIDGEELVTYRNFHELAFALERLLAAPASAQEIADKGRAKALARLSPTRLAGTMLALAARPR